MIRTVDRETLEQRIFEKTKVRTVGDARLVASIVAIDVQLDTQLSEDDFVFQVNEAVNLLLLDEVGVDKEGLKSLLILQ